MESAADTCFCKLYPKYPTEFCMTFCFGSGSLSEYSVGDSFVSRDLALLVFHLCYQFRGEGHTSGLQDTHLAMWGDSIDSPNSSAPHLSSKPASEVGWRLEGGGATVVKPAEWGWNGPESSHVDRWGENKRPIKASLVIRRPRFLREWQLPFLTKRLNHRNAEPVRLLVRRYERFRVFSCSLRFLLHDTAFSK